MTNDELTYEERLELSCAAAAVAVTRHRLGGDHIDGTLCVAWGETILVLDYCAHDWPSIKLLPPQTTVELYGEGWMN